MAVDNTGLFYSTIEDFSEWVSQNFAGILADDNPNSFDTFGDAPKEKIKFALLNAEGVIDGYLKLRGYKVPIDNSYVRSVTVLRMCSYNIALYELYGRRGLTKERYYKYENVMRDLREYRDNKKDLPDDLPLVSVKKISSGSSMQSVFASTPRDQANNI